MENQDLAFGLCNEVRVLSLLQERDPTIRKIEFKYSLFDFCNETTLWELKTRKNKSTTFSTVFIGANKINQALINSKSTDKKTFFLFDFTDKLMQWEFNMEEFPQLLFRDFTRTSRGIAEQSNIYEIPISLLKPF